MKCPICQKYQLSLQAEALLQHDTLSYPWQYVSKSPFVKRLYSTTSTAVINQLKQLFEERGLPEIVFSDNGPQYTSEKFASFSRKYNFRHVTSLPHYPQSNGFAERMVGICKRLLSKAIDSGEDCHLTMMAYRATPVSNNIKSPAELLNGSPIRNQLISKQQLRDEYTQDCLEKSKDLVHPFSRPTLILVLKSLPCLPGYEHSRIRFASFFAWRTRVIVVVSVTAAMKIVWEIHSDLSIL